jgi:CDP-paratose 2-epimerase
VRVLVTGSSGLIGSEAVAFYDRLGAEVCGLDNNGRAEYFGPGGDTTPTLRRLQKTTRRLRSFGMDVRDRGAVMGLFEAGRFDLVVHCAAQPSHDLARDIPFVDFEVNAVGTLNLLEATRRHSSRAVFVLLSTNKVYGDAPNERPLVELPTRYDYANREDAHGISEECRIDRSLHSLFGVSKAAADLLAQEYARTFGLPVGIFRCGCLTGPAHAGVELHGFLSHLVKCGVRDEPYTVFGYQGKQVRDNLHAADVVTAIDAFRRAPRPGEVYNLGGGRDNSISILEAFAAVAARTGRSPRHRYVDQPRLGDHICYISDARKFRAHFPEWVVSRSLASLLDELVDAELSGVGEARR